jgi:tetratricopeptide (TPR) repeat protein
LAAIQIYPNYFLAFEKLALHYINLQDFKNSSQAAQRAVEINPKSFDSWYALGYSMHQLKDFSGAATALKVALTLNPGSVNALFVLGTDLRLSGDPQESEANLLKAKKLAPSPVAEIHWQLALLYTNNLKKYPEAIKELELFLKASPNYAEVDKVKTLIATLRSKVKNGKE